MFLGRKNLLFYWFGKFTVGRLCTQNSPKPTKHDIFMTYIYTFESFYHDHIKNFRIS